MELKREAEKKSSCSSILEYKDVDGIPYRYKMKTLGMERGQDTNKIGNASLSNIKFVTG
jgi:hypothetical protein